MNRALLWACLAALLSLPAAAQECPGEDCSPGEVPFYVWDGDDGRMLYAVPVSYLIHSEEAPEEVVNNPRFAELAEEFSAVMEQLQRRKGPARCAPYGDGGLIIPPPGATPDTRVHTAFDMIESQSVALLGRVERVVHYWDYGTITVPVLRIEEVLKDPEGIFTHSDSARFVLWWGTMSVAGVIFCSAPPKGLDAGLTQDFHKERIIAVGSYDRWNEGFIELTPSTIFRVVGDEVVHPRSEVNYATGGLGLEALRASLED